jgi:hypothetical protein
MVSPKEADECNFLFVTQAASNQSSLERVAFLQLDGLDANIAGVGFHWLGLWLEISNSESVSFCAIAKTSVEGSGKHDVVAYSIASWSQSYNFFKSLRNVSMPVLPGILSSR